MNKPKDYVNLNLYVGHMDQSKMTQEEMSSLHAEITNLLIDKGYHLFGGAGLLDDDELAETMNYSDEVLKQEASQYASLPNPETQIVISRAEAFFAGAQFVRSKVDERYR